MSISAVAKGANVSSALLHNRYPDFAEEIREVIGKGTRVQRDKKHELLIQEREKNRELRELLAERLAEIVKLASINEALRVELTLQREFANGKVTRLQNNR